MKNRTVQVVAGLAAIAVIAVLVVLLTLLLRDRDGGATFGSSQVDDKEQYTTQLGVAYAADHDLDKAKAELDKLGIPNTSQWVAELAERSIRQGGDEQETRGLVELAEALGVVSAPMIAYLATDTPLPTNTPTPTATPTYTPTPTETPSPTPTSTPVPPTDTPTSTPVPPTDTPTVTPTFTKAPPTPKPKPKATSTPKPTATPAVKWTWSEHLVAIGEDAQSCSAGLLQIRVTVVDAAGNQIPNIWVYDRYSNQYQVTSNVDSPDWGSGETKFEYGRWGGGSLCIATGQGGTCETAYSRDMPCFAGPPFEDMWNAGYCQCCGTDYAANKALCQGLYDSHHVCLGAGHYSWRIVYKRSW